MKGFPETLRTLPRNNKAFAKVKDHAGVHGGGAGLPPGLPGGLRAEYNYIFDHKKAVLVFLPFLISHFYGD